MKKVGVLVAVAGLLGCASAAFAQGSPSVDAKTTGMAWSGMSLTSQAHVEPADAMNIGKNLTKETTKANLFHHILAQRPVSLSYRLQTHVTPQCQVVAVPDCAPVTSYPANGTFSGRVYQYNNVNYVLISYKVWEAIDEMSSTNWLTQTFGGKRIVSQTFVTSNGEEYSQAGSKKLNAQRYEYQGEQYAVIAFPFADNK